MKPKRKSVIQHVLVLLVVLAMPQIASADEPNPTKSSRLHTNAGFDGEWITEHPFYPPDAWGVGFPHLGRYRSFHDDVQTERSEKKVGDVVLRITRTSATTFRGYLIRYDGNPYPVNGVLLLDGRLGMQVSGGGHPTKAENRALTVYKFVDKFNLIGTENPESKRGD